MAANRNQQLVIYQGPGQVGGANAPPYKKEHFSHRHWLYRFQVQPKDGFDCAICEKPCNGVVYGCQSCRYYLHDPCCSLPRKIQLNCHRHPLTLRSTPAYNSGGFYCNACGEDGEGFNYNCSTCNYDLHVACASLPATLSTGFKYKIYLYYSFPKKNEAAPVFCCMCDEAVNKNNWLYFNRGTDFVYHVDCALDEKTEGEDVAEVSQACRRLALLELKN